MQTSAARRFRKSGFSVLAAYFVVFLTVEYVVERTHPVGKLIWLCAALPALPLVLVFFLMGRYLHEETDEYKRDLAVRCLLWGLGGAMSVQVFQSFLQIFGWTGRFVPFCELFVFVIMMLAAKLSYRAANRVPADA